MERNEFLAPKEYFSDKYKKLELEKTMEYNKTHIIPTNYKKNLNSNDFIKDETDSYKRLWFKLYKTQNYTVCPEMFVGITSITDYTIKEYQYCIRLIESAHKEGKSISDISKHNIGGLEPYILSLKKQGIIPYPTVKVQDSKKKYHKIKVLVDSGMLDVDEISFIYSPMQDICKYAKFVKTDEPKPEKVSELKRPSAKQTEGYHKIIAENYKLSHEEIAKLVPLYSDNTIKSYVRQCVLLETSQGEAKVHSEPLKNAWLEVYKNKPDEQVLEEKVVEEEIPVQNNEDVSVQDDEEVLVQDPPKSSEDDVPKKISTFGVYVENEVCVVNSNLDYLNGFKAAIAHFFETNAIIVKIEQI